MPQTIVFSLAAKLHGLLQTELHQTRYQEDRVAMGLLLVLSRYPFRDGLLFRDFSQDPADLWLRPTGHQREADFDRDSDPGSARKSQADTLPVSGGNKGVYKPALTYLTLVLSRRLTLANNLRDQPTNLHVLMASLAAHGPEAQGWPQVQIARAPSSPAAAPQPPFFARVARVLAAQVRRLGGGYGPISASRRSAYGPYRLTLPGCGAEVAEELNLWDCLAALPVPMERDLDEASLLRLVRVLESLNERYALLRSCGLDPEQWHDDGDLSLGDLQQLRELKRAAESCSSGTPEAAYAAAFKTLRAANPTIAGFETFAAFTAGSLGQQLIHRGPLSLHTPLSGEDEDLVLEDSLAAPDPESGVSAPEHQLKQAAAVQYVLAHCPAIQRDPVLAWFARATLAEGCTIWGPGGVLADPDFRRLVDASSKYPATDDEALVQALARNLDEAIRYCTRTLAPVFSNGVTHHD